MLHRPDYEPKKAAPRILDRTDYCTIHLLVTLAPFVTAVLIGCRNPEPLAPFALVAVIGAGTSWILVRTSPFRIWSWILLAGYLYLTIPMVAFAIWLWIRRWS